MLMSWQQSIPAASTTQAEESAILQQLQTELGSAWELKILHSASHAFASIEHVATAAEQEARAGWEIVGQWDDTRLIFKRSSQTGANDDQQPSLNPYRETYTAPTEVIQTLIGAVLLLGTLIGLAIVLSTGGA